jgi:hypothetical protein
MPLQSRDQLAHFLGPKGGPYTRLGKGFAELTNSMSPTTQEKKYIDGTGDSITTSYDITWAVNGDVYSDDPANELLYKMAYNRVKGADAYVEMLTCQFWVPSEFTPVAFEGYKQEMSWAPDNSGGGSAEESVTFSGELKAKGDKIDGWITVTPGVDGAAATAVYSATPPPDPGA